MPIAPPLHTADQTVSKSIHVQYFAVFREQAGRSDEVVETTNRTPAELYAGLCERHHFKLSRQQVRVAVNDEFASWDAELRAGDRVVFIPPVAGG